MRGSSNIGGGIAMWKHDCFGLIFYFVRHNAAIGGDRECMFIVGAEFSTSLMNGAPGRDKTTTTTTHILCSVMDAAARCSRVDTDDRSEALSGNNTYSVQSSSAIELPYNLVHRFVPWRA
jgi:hypothetical protein